MAAEPPLLRHGVALGVSVAVAQLVDRRPNATGEPQEWAFQRDVEAALYGNGYSQQTGAVYRLLKRCGVGARSLALRKAAVAQDLISQADFDRLISHLGDVRSFTLIPLDALRTTLSTFGCDARSEALVNALGIARPDDWAVEEEEEEEKEEEEVEEEEEGAVMEEEEDEEDEGGAEGGGNEDGDGAAGGGGGGSGNDDDDDDAGSDHAVSIAGTEVVDEPVVLGANDDDAEAEHASPIKPTKRQHVELEPIYVTPKLEAELSAFQAHRVTPLNQARKGAAVTQATCESDRVRVLRFLAWLRSNYKLKSPPTLGIFSNANIGKAARRYAEDLVEVQGRKYSYTAKIAASLVAVASFVATQRASRGDTASTQPVAELSALHLQCRQQARQEDKFDLAERPESWLDWDAIQRVRVAAETALSTATTDAKKLTFTRDVTVLRLLADQPPDRVGIVRSLKLGTTLKRKPDGSYELDLSEPGAHKTSAVFGPSRTTINASIAPWLDRYIELAEIPADGGYLFHARDDKLDVISPSAWTHRVKATFGRHGGVALCPKDARSSFVTFLKSGEHDDDAVRAAAAAMRHSSKTQASASYDKGASDRRVAAAMKVAADFSAKFTAEASSSTEPQ